MQDQLAMKFPLREGWVRDTESAGGKLEGFPIWARVWDSNYGWEAAATRSIEGFANLTATCGFFPYTDEGFVEGQEWCERAVDYLGSCPMPEYRKGDR